MVAEIYGYGKWVPGGWKAVGRLQSRSLKGTQMEFSRDDIMLLAVSRDGLLVFEKQRHLACV